MKTLATVLTLVLCWNQSFADAGTQLRVTATIPPKPCDVDKTCESTSKPVAASATRAIVRADRISYVGSRPRVEEKDGVRTLLF